MDEKQKLIKSKSHSNLSIQPSRKATADKANKKVNFQLPKSTSCPDLLRWKEFDLHNLTKKGE